MNQNVIKDVRFIKTQETMMFTAVIEKSEDGWYVGQIEEVPAAISQGETIEELKENLQDALQLIFEANREAMHSDYEGKTVMKEQIRVAV